MSAWADIAIAAALFAGGNIVFGHFEAGTPKWRRLLKLALFLIVIGVLARYAGHAWSAAFVALAAGAGLAAHFTILHRHGIDPWTAEPLEKYYALRGWRR